MSVGSGVNLLSWSHSEIWRGDSLLRVWGWGVLSVTPLPPFMTDTPTWGFPLRDWTQRGSQWTQRLWGPCWSSSTRWWHSAPWGSFWHLLWRPSSCSTVCSTSGNKVGMGGAARVILPSSVSSLPGLLSSLSRLSFAFFPGFHCALVPLFNPKFSPRNLVLVAARTPLATVLAGLDKDSEDGDSIEDRHSNEDEDLGEAESPREGQSPGHRPQ